MKYAYKCEHNVRPHRSLGLCNACYLKQNGGSKKWYSQNKEKIKKKASVWAHENREKRLNIARRWAKKAYLADPEKYKEKTTKLYKTNLNYRISGNLRSRLRTVLKNNIKSASVLTFIGCSVEELKRHLEKRFVNGMSWDNYGFYGWHIDHIKPCAAFDLSISEQQALCFHYTNLQPLWATENKSKCAKYE